jgi:transcriptional regulator with XRE-family HTH domain
MLTGMTITTPATWGTGGNGETYAERVSAEVRAWMARRGMTQTDMASALGVTQMYVSRRMKRFEPTPMDVTDLARFAEVLGCGVVDLLPSTVAASDTRYYPEAA